MKTKNLLIKTFMVCAIAAPMMVSCSDDKVPVYEVGVENALPQGVVIEKMTANFTEINTGVVTTVESLNDLHLPAGIYNIEATATVTTASKADADQKTMRAVAQNVVITETTKSIKLEWFYYNPNNSLVFSELYVSGSLNATGKAGLYDTYFRIYNNTDEVIYADGIAICESDLNNATAYKDITPGFTPEDCLITGTIYVIPGNGTDVPIEPGKSIKIVDQAINWSESVPGAQNHLDADFEWYDLVTIGTLRDTDNTDVPNLDKWYSYSVTIWIPNQQANKSYALVKFPAGMTAEKYLNEYQGSYTYIHPTTNKQIAQNNKYYIPLDWIIDGVNLCPTAKYNFSCLPASIDMSYKAIHDDPQSAADRCGKVFSRRQAGVSPAGNIILQDTDDSANDFEIIPAK